MELIDCPACGDNLALADRLDQLLIVPLPDNMTRYECLCGTISDLLEGKLYRYTTCCLNHAYYADAETNA